MYFFKNQLINTFVICTAMLLVSCGDKQSEHGLANNESDLQIKISSLVKKAVENKFLNIHELLTDSSIVLNEPDIVSYIYESKNLIPVWSYKQSWLTTADSLFDFIEASKLYGLFPEDYHLEKIKAIREKFKADSMGKSEKRNVVLWTSADILMTDAFAKILKDIKMGRLPRDSITLRKDSVLEKGFYLAKLNAISNKPFHEIIAGIEPKHRGYQLLKQGIKKFLDSADYKSFTHVPYPVTDKTSFQTALQKRLFEGGYIAFHHPAADSVQLSIAIKSFQKKKGITEDGRAGEATVRLLNVNDREKFIRIAISLDKYKMLPEKMPSKYIWVNASANMLELVEQEGIKFTSKVICGKAKTRTPLLTSNITQIITYPQWVPPPSIVSREILPAVKRNPGYLSRRGFHLVDSKGNTVDPYSVNWAKYKNAVPYRIVQGSGDANALGVMKFVFDNKYSVYLHDTNQRYLFNNSMRSLSHGCVRVQDWEKLTYYILNNDSLLSTSRNYTSTDSLKTWLKAKQKKSIAVKNKIPLYIRYITCEGINGNIRFYDDVYAEDRLLREKYFSSK